jgi:hypothetical protein
MIRSLPLRITLIKPPPGVPFCEVVPINNSIALSILTLNLWDPILASNSRYGSINDAFIGVIDFRDC